jgi:hypothetical protein
MASVHVHALLISACAGSTFMLLPTALLLHFVGAAPQPRFVADGAKLCPSL